MTSLLFDFAWFFLATDHIHTYHYNSLSTTLFYHRENTTPLLVPELTFTTLSGSKSQPDKLAELTCLVKFLLVIHTCMFDQRSIGPDWEHKNVLQYITSINVWPKLTHLILLLGVFCFYIQYVLQELIDNPWWHDDFSPNLTCIPTFQVTMLPSQI